MTYYGIIEEICEVDYTMFMLNQIRLIYANQWGVNWFCKIFIDLKES